MNSFLISLGAALAVALVAAFIGPAFVDWNAYRDRIEAEATRILCRDVAIGGDLEVRLLPQPKITTGRMNISDTEGVALATVENTTMHLGLGQLLLGGIEVTALELDRPKVALATAGDGHFNWGPAASGGCDPELARVTFRQATVSNGIVSLVDGVTGASLVLDHVDLTVTAGGLAGPYRVTGAHGTADARKTISLSSGRVDTGAPTRVSGRLDLGAKTEATFDGTLIGWNRPPHYSGALRIVRALGEAESETAELRVEARAEIGSAGSEFTDLTITASEGGESATAIGKARIAQVDGRPRANIELKSRRLNLGAFSDADSQIGAAIAVLAAGASNELTESNLTGTLSFDVSGAVYRGELVQDIAAVLNFGAESIGIETFNATLPGQSEFGFSGGLVGDNDGGKLVGTLVLNTRDLRRLLAWSLPDAQRGIVEFVPVNHGKLSVTGGFAAEPGNIEMTGVEGLLEGDSFSGDISISGGAQGEIHADLDFDDLDLDRLIAVDYDPFDLLAGLAQADAGGTERPLFGLEVSAKRIGWRGREARGADLIATFDDGAITLERFALADFAGSAIEIDGEGRLVEGGVTGNLNVGLDTSDLLGTAGAAGLDLQDWLGRGPSWAALVASADLRARILSTEQTGVWRVQSSLSGRVGDTDIDAELRSDASPGALATGPISGHATLVSQDAGRLLAQIGLVDTDTTTPNEVGTVDFEVAGSIADGFSYAANADGLEARLIVEGRAETASGDLTGDLSVEFGDLHRVAGLIGMPLGDAKGVTADLSSTLNLRDGQLEFRDILGSAAGASVAGGARMRLGENAEIALKLDSLSLPWVLDTLFVRKAPPAAMGAGAASTGAVWSSDLIETSALDGLPISARIGVGRLDLAPGLDLDDAIFEASIGEGAFEVRTISGALDDGGTFDASGRLEQTELSLELTGTVSADGMPLSGFLVDAGERDLITGTGDLDLRFEAAGRSLLSLASSLNGEGRIQGANIALPRLLVAPLLRRAVGAVDATAARALISQARGGETALKIGGGRVVAKDGRITVGPLAATSEGLTGAATAFINLTAGSVDQEIRLRAGNGPELSIVHAGPFDAIGRTVELVGLSVGPVTWEDSDENRTVPGDGIAGRRGPGSGVPAGLGPPAGVIEERVFELPLGTGGAG